MRRPASRLLLLTVLALGLAGPALAGKLADAEAAFAAGRDAQAMQLYTDAIAEAGDDASAKATAYFGRGEVHAINRRTDEAVADFSAVVALPVDAETRANAYFSRAEALSRRRRWEPALADYAEALKLQPMLIGAHYARGRALRALDRPQEAVAEFDAELKINPDSFRAQSQRADLLGLPQPRNHARDGFGGGFGDSAGSD